MKWLLFLLPVLFLACGTQPKTANGALQQETGGEEAAVKESPEKEPVKETAAQRYTEEEAAKGEQADVKASVETQIPGGLSQESYEQIFNEVKVFIENLNTVIRNKNYSKWREALSKERLNEISSPEFLADASKTNSMKRRGIVLKTVYDYFLYVVVPSRTNSQVDKIDILDNNRVRVLYMQTRKTATSNEEQTETIPLLVYELAKTGNSWTIIR
jgi:hypothetical protein